MDGKARTEVERQMSSVPAADFSSTFAAKEFLIGKIVLQAQLEQESLTKDEEKILYFTEQEPTVADEIKDFPDYDPAFEEKVTGLIRRCYKREQSLPGGGDSQKFKNAVELLKAEDHYLLIMAAPVFEGVRGSGFTQVTPMKAVLIVIVLGVLMVLGAWTMGRLLP